VKSKRLALTVLTSSLLAAAGFAAPAFAASGPVSVTTCGDLTGPGTYRLDADLPTCTITLTGSNTKLLLNRHTLLGAGIDSPSAGAAGTRNLIVGPGTVTGNANAALIMGHTKNSAIAFVTATGNRVGLATVADGSKNLIFGNNLNHNDAGVQLLGGTAVLSTNDADNNTGNGIEIFVAGNTIVDNTADENGTWGIVVEDAAIQNCTANYFARNSASGNGVEAQVAPDCIQPATT
jgi:hypothetical protein